MRDQAIDRYGKIHVLCNNAGVTSRQDGGLGAGTGAVPVWEVPDSTWDWVMGVNFWGVLYGLQVFVPSMLTHGEEGSHRQHGIGRRTDPRRIGLQRLQARRPHPHRGPLASPASRRLQHLRLSPLPRLRQHPDQRGGTQSSRRIRPVDRSQRGSAHGLPASFSAAEWILRTSPNWSGRRCVDDHLYILPHDGWRDIIHGRIEAVLEGQQPVEIDFQKMMERRAQGEMVLGRVHIAARSASQRAIPAPSPPLRGEMPQPEGGTPFAHATDI